MHKFNLDWSVVPRRIFNFYFQLLMLPTRHATWALRKQWPPVARATEAAAGHLDSCSVRGLKWTSYTCKSWPRAAAVSAQPTQHLTYEWYLINLPSICNLRCANVRIRNVVLRRMGRKEGAIVNNRPNELFAQVASDFPSPSPSRKENTLFKVYKKTLTAAWKGNFVRLRQVYAEHPEVAVSD